MPAYDTNKIHDAVLALKEIKKTSFLKKDGIANFKQAKETCRIIDTFILPLYYIWEHKCHRELTELDFEAHLKSAYQKFMKNPLANTWELSIFISIDTPFGKEFNNKNLSKNILEIYQQFLNTKK